jgi:hypothetical protein
MAMLKALFDPSNTEDNMDKWVNYRGKVLQPPFSFMSAESVAHSGNFDLETCLLGIRVFYAIIWMFGGKLVHLLKSLASQRMVLIFESTLGILRVNVAMLTNHQ